LRFATISSSHLTWLCLQAFRIPSSCCPTFFRDPRFVELLSSPFGFRQRRYTRGEPQWQAAGWGNVEYVLQRTSLLEVKSEALIRSALGVFLLRHCSPLFDVSLWKHDHLLRILNRNAMRRYPTAEEGAWWLLKFLIVTTQPAEIPTENGLRRKKQRFLNSPCEKHATQFRQHSRQFPIR
jgi:hypothetical protein